MTLPAPPTRRKMKIDLVNLSPAGGFWVAFHGDVAASMLAAPLVLYFVASFVFPALRMEERKYVYHPGMFYGLGLFFTRRRFLLFLS